MMLRSGHSRRAVFCAVVLSSLITGAASTAAAQTGSAQLHLHRWAPAVSPGDTLGLSSAQQIAFPLEVRFSAGQRWTIDASGAWTKGTATYTSRTGTNVSRELTGPTDIRLRATGSFLADAVSLAVGINAPTGKTKLNDDELNVLRVLAAPAAGMPAPVLGTGFGLTVGVITARSIGGAAFAVGAAFEKRGEYTAFEQVAAGVPATTRITPGPAVHLSLGVSGATGTGDMSLNTTVNLFGTDVMGVGTPQLSARSSYRLGRMFNVQWMYRPGVRRLPDLRFAVGARHRAPYEDDVVGTVDGSSATLASATVSSTVWRNGAWRLRGNLEGRWYTGMDVDSSFVTASFNDIAFTATLGLPAGRARLEPFVRVGMGSVDLKTASYSMTTVTVGGSWVMR